jgi:predicted TIM-barrel fold metal-dependent hydrolase
MDAAGVDRAYLVPGNSSANAACVDAVRRWPNRFRAMGLVPLDRPEGPAMFEDFGATGMHGVRLVFPPYRKVSWLQDGTADWFWPHANRLKLPVMVWAPSQSEKLGEIATAHPDIRFVVDHLNLYVEDRGETITRAVDSLLPLAALRNVAVKATALPAHSSEPFPFRDMHRHVERVVEAFGASRVFWGTDITRRACTYREAIDMFTKALPFLRGGDLDDVMGAAAVRWIGW